MEEDKWVAQAYTLEEDERDSILEENEQTVPLGMVPSKGGTIIQEGMAVKDFNLVCCHGLDLVPFCWPWFSAKHRNWWPRP